MSDWDQRQLCPDGGCTGVLGSDGTCNSCGKRGRPADAAAVSSAGEAAALRGDATDFAEDEEYYEDDDGEYEDDDEDSDEADDDDDGEPDAEEDGVASVAWTDRALCPDGGCIGVIGDTGTCKVCGRSAAS